MKLGEAHVVVEAKGLSKYDRDLRKAQQRTDKFGKSSSKSINSVSNSIRNLGLVAGAVLGAALVGKLLKETTRAASDLQETTSKFSTVFKDQIKEAKNFSTILRDGYAMSNRESKFFLSSVQDLLVPMGVASKQAAKMSFEVSKLAADLGSFNNLKTEQVMLDMQSALVGNFETMKKYGVVLNATVTQQKALEMGLALTKNELTAGHKAMAAYQLIVEGSAAAVGDMARTSGDYANQMKKLEANIEDVKAVLGQELLPVLADMAIRLNAWIKELRESGDSLGVWSKAIAESVVAVSKVVFNSIALMVSAFQKLQSVVALTVGFLGFTIAKEGSEFEKFFIDMGAFADEMGTKSAKSLGTLTNVFTETTEEVKKYDRAIVEATVNTDSFNMSIESIGAFTKKAFADTRESIRGYEWFANKLQDENEDIKDSSEDTFSSMADFYKDALLQMVDGTGSFVDMIKGKMKNLAATIASEALTSITGNILNSITGGGTGISGILKSFTGVSGGGGSIAPTGFMTVPANISQVGESALAATSGVTGSGTGLMSSISKIAGPVGILLTLIQGFEALESNLDVASSKSKAVDNQGIERGLNNLAGFMRTSADLVGLGQAWDVISFGNFGLDKQFKALRHRMHRAQRYSSLLQELSIGTEEEPFDITKFSGIEDFLGTSKSGGIGRLADPKSIHAIGKFGNVQGEGLSSQLRAVGESLKDYKNIVDQYSGASTNAALESQKMSTEIDRLDKNFVGLTEEGKRTVAMFKQLRENAIALQLKDISASFAEGATSIAEYAGQLDILDLGEQETATLKYSAALKLLTDDTRAYSGELLYARELMLESKDVMNEQTKATEDANFKLMLLNSSLEFSDAQLATLKDSTSEVNIELLNMFAAMGMLDQEVVIVAEDLREAANAEEWFNFRAEDLRNIVSDLTDVVVKADEVFKELGVTMNTVELEKMAHGLNQVADALEAIGSLSGALTGIGTGGISLIENLLVGNWQESSVAIMDLIGNVNTLTLALQTLGLVKLATGAGVFGQVLIIGLAIIEILNIAKTILGDLFGGKGKGKGKGGGKGDISITPQDFFNLMNPITQGSFTSDLGDAFQSGQTGFEGMESAIKQIENKRMQNIIFGLRQIAKGKTLPEGWGEAIWESGEKAIKDLRDNFAKAFKDFSSTLTDDIEAITGIRDVDKRLKLAKSEFGGMDITDEDFLQKAKELRDLTLEKFNIEKRGLDELIGVWQGVADNVARQLSDLMTSTANPADIFERLSIQRGEVERLQGLVGSTTGLEQAGFAGDLSSALGEYLRLAQDAYQRPSSEYQAIFDEVTTELRKLRDTALEEVSVAEQQLITLQKMTVDGLHEIKFAVDRLTVAITTGKAPKTKDLKGVPPVANVIPEPSSIWDTQSPGERGGSWDDWVEAVASNSIRNGRLREDVKRAANSRG